MKKIIGLLLALCLIVGLLPVVAAADEVQFDGAAKIRLVGRYDMYIKEGDAPKYAKTNSNGEVSTADDTNWNIKFEYVDDWAVLTLKGARLGKHIANDEYAKDYMRQVHAIECPIESPFYRLKVIVEEDSIFDTGFGGIICQGSNDTVMMSDIWIESVGDAKLDIFCRDGYRALRAADYDSYEGTLTINANLSITQIVDYRYSTSLTASHVVIKGGNITLNNANACIDAKKSLTIEGGNITMNCSNGAVICPIQMPNGEVTINGGTVKMYKTEEGGGGVINCEKLTINGGTVYGEGYTYAINASEVEFNGGVIELKALSEDGDAQVFIDGAPDLAGYTNPAAVLGASKDDVAKYTTEYAAEAETGYFMLATAGTPEAPNVPADEPEPTEPPATEPPATEPPATEPPATSGNNNGGNNDSNTDDTKKPEESKGDSNNNDNNNNNSNDNNNDNSDLILWIVAGVLLVVAGVVAFIIVRKNRADDEDDDDEEAVEENSAETTEESAE